MKKLGYLVFISFLAINCQKHSEDLATSDNATVVEMADISVSDNNITNAPEVEDVNNSSDKNISSKKIIEATLRISDNNLDKARQNIIKILSKDKCEIAEENSSTNSIYLKIYVPRKNFDQIVSEFNTNNFDKINSKSVNITDITKKYYTLKNEISTQSILIDKYQELLKKSNDISDILTINEKIEELEQSRRINDDFMAYYNKMQDYNLLHLYVESTYPNAFENPSFWSKTKTALSDSINLIENLFFGLLSIWPIILGIILIIIVWKKKLFKQKAK